MANSTTGKKVYRSVTGFVQFPPRDGEAAGKPIRSLVLNTAGLGDQSQKVYVTVWPSHGAIKIDQGDFLAVEGSFTQNTGVDKDGRKTMYLNLSATRIAKLGSEETGQEDDVTEALETTSSDLPF